MTLPHGFLPLPHPPTSDLITSLNFTPRSHTPHLLVSTMTGDISLYNTSTLSQLATLSNQESILDLQWDPHGMDAYLGDTGGNVKRIDFENGKCLDLFDDDIKHSAGVKRIRFFGDRLVSGSWDKTLRYTDIRARSAELVRLDQKVIAMDCTQDKVIVCCGDRLNYVYDVRDTKRPLFKGLSALNYFTRNVKCTPLGEGFVQSSIDGRCQIDYFEERDKPKAYGFKAHRDVKDGEAHTYVVNALAFHDKQLSLFTGASDGHLTAWNWRMKKRSKDYGVFSESVLHMDFKENQLVVAIGDDSYKSREAMEGWSMDNDLIGRSGVYVKTFDEVDTRTTKREK